MKSNKKSSKALNKNYFNSYSSSVKSPTVKVNYVKTKNNASYLKNFKNQVYSPPVAKKQPANSLNENYNTNKNSSNNFQNPMQKMTPFLDLIKNGGKLNTKNIGSLVSSLNGDNSNPNLSKILGAANNSEGSNLSSLNNIMSLMSGGADSNNPQNLLLSILPALLTNRSGIISAKNNNIESVKKIESYKKA